MKQIAVIGACTNHLEFIIALFDILGCVSNVYECRCSMNDSMG